MKKSYSFSDGVFGRYAKRFALGAYLVAIDPDVFKAFHNSRLVNEALLNLIRIAQKAASNGALL